MERVLTGLLRVSNKPSSSARYAYGYTHHAGIFIEKNFNGENQDFLKLRGASLVSRLSCVV